MLSIHTLCIHPSVHDRIIYSRTPCNLFIGWNMMDSEIMTSRERERKRDPSAVSRPATRRGCRQTPQARRSPAPHARETLYAPVRQQQIDTTFPTPRAERHQKSANDYLGDPTKKCFRTKLQAFQFSNALTPNFFLLFGLFNMNVRARVMVPQGPYNLRISGLGQSPS